jgi:hypothetical protein
MCTVTLLPMGQGCASFLRLACNRDEARTRPPALPPRLRRFGRRRALLPIDPTSQGTWIAVNDAGLAFVLLNRNPAKTQMVQAAHFPSRGTIIPMLLHCASVLEASRLACSLARQSFAPFRLILTSRELAVEIVPGGGCTESRELPLDRPHMFTSSGLGDDLVEKPRRLLFERSLQREDGATEEQDRFHRHSWPQRGHLSVCMSREDACTVSYTVIELRAGAACMFYFPQAPDEPCPVLRYSLELEAVETT